MHAVSANALAVVSAVASNGESIECPLKTAMFDKPGEIV
jgi:hypothetical protein